MNKNLRMIVLGGALAGMVTTSVSAMGKCGTGKCGSSSEKKCEAMKCGAEKEKCMEEHKKKMDK